MECLLNFYKEVVWLKTELEIIRTNEEEIAEKGNLKNKGELNNRNLNDGSFLNLVCKNLDDLINFYIDFV